MSRKPTTLIYGVDDKPTINETAALGIQHVLVMAVALIFPVIIIREINGTLDQATNILRMSLVAGGIGVIVQSIRKGPMGTGYLCPQVCSPTYLSASMVAGKMAATPAAGLALVFGGTFMAGVLETIFSRFVTRLRALFPPEVIGTVVALVGITVVPVTMKQFLGIRNAGDSVAIRDIAVAATTLLIMMGISVWSRGKLRLYSVLIGMAAGYLLSWMLGLLGSDEMQHVQDASWFGIPLPGGYGWALTWASVVPFAVAALCSSLKSMGDLVTCQKINDADWKRPDMQSVSRGILADAVGAMSAGVLGGMGQSTSTHNVALTLATGATSRRIAWATGAILLLLACFPKVAFFLVIMPSPVVGATLAFCIAFMILAGIQIISSRMLDTRKMLVVGIAIIVGLSVDVIPNGYRDVHPYLQPLFTSSLAIGTVTAIALNLIFRIGVSRRKRLVLRPDDKDVGEAVYRFMDAQGRAWGARPEIIARATRVLTEFAELNADQGLAKGDVTADVSFDEFNLNLRVQYEGRPLEFPESAPTAEEIVADETSLARLSAALIRRSVDRLRCEEKNGQCILHFHYEH